MTQDKYVLVPSDKLLPCPFCGSEPHIPINGNSTVITCSNIDCVFSPVPFNDYNHLKTAIEAWNTRAAPTIAQPQSVPITRERILAIIDKVPELWTGDNGKSSDEILADLILAELPSQNESVRLALPEVADRVETADTYSYGFYVGWNAYRNLLLEYNPTINADEREG